VIGPDSVAALAKEGANNAQAKDAAKDAEADRRFFMPMPDIPGSVVSDRNPWANSNRRDAMALSVVRNRPE
jgi:hypothetical protein